LLHVELGAVDKFGGDAVLQDADLAEGRAAIARGPPRRPYLRIDPEEIGKVQARVVNARVAKVPLVSAFGLLVCLVVLLIELIEGLTRGT
jgi:hypothetical protein